MYVCMCACVTPTLNIILGGLIDYNDCGEMGDYKSRVKLSLLILGL